MLPCENRVNLRNTLCNTRLWRIWHSFLFYQCIWYRGPDGPTREAPNRPAAGRRMVGREIPDEHEDSDDTESLTALYASPPHTRKASLSISESMSHRWGKDFEGKQNKKILWKNQLKLSTWWNLSVLYNNACRIVISEPIFGVHGVHLECACKFKTCEVMLAKKRAFDHLREHESQVRKILKGETKQFCKNNQLQLIVWWNLSVQHACWIVIPERLLRSRWVPECASQRHANDVSHKSGMAKNVDHFRRMEQVDDCKTCYGWSLPHRPGTAELIWLLTWPSCVNECRRMGSLLSGLVRKFQGESENESYLPLNTEDHGALDHRYERDEVPSPRILREGISGQDEKSTTVKNSNARGTPTSLFVDKVCKQKWEWSTCSEIFKSSLTDCSLAHIL